MFSSIFKFALSFALSFIILSMPIQGKPVFTILNKHFSKQTKYVLEVVSDFMRDGLETTKDLASKLISTNIPEPAPGTHQDIISSKASGIKKKEILLEKDLTKEERHALEKILEESRH